MDPTAPASLSRRAQRNYSNSPDSAIQPIWTTARCNRLLRPLSSKLALLRKVQRRSSTGESEKEKDVIGIKPDPLRDYGSSWGANDAICQANMTSKSGLSGWTQSPRPRKKIKRTYSSRDSGQEEKTKFQANIYASNISISHGENLIPVPKNNRKENNSIPINDRMKDLETSQLTSTTPPNRNRSLHPQTIARASIRRFAKIKYPDRWALVEGIQNGLETLLKASTDVHRVDRAGARSLFSICLKNTSRYIAMEEARYKLEDPDNTIDISSAVYGDLEAYASSLTGGWKPLSEVTRSHGVMMLGSAVRDGVIDLPMAHNLVKLCLHHGAINEGRHIVECVLTTLTDFPPPTSINDRVFCQSLSVLNHFTSVSSQFGFQYRQLTQLFRNGILPIGWISSRNLVECWSRVIRSITASDFDARDAGLLLRTVLLMSSGITVTSVSSKIHDIRLQLSNIGKSPLVKALQVEKAGNISRDKHLEHFITQDMCKATGAISSSLLVTLTAIEFLQYSGVVAGPNNLRMSNQEVLQDIALQARQALEPIRIHNVSDDNSKLDMDRLCLSLMAAGLVLAVRQDTLRIASCLDAILSVDSSPEFSNSAASFICAVAECCSRATSDHTFTHLQEIVQQLIDIFTTSSHDVAARKFVGNIAIIAAIQYSQATSIPKHLSWALDIESIVSRMTVGVDTQTPCKTPQRGLIKTKPKFRWEEGICEWVAGTPIIPIPKPAIFKDPDNATQNSDWVPSLASQITLKSSPTKAPMCLTEASPTSSKVNGAKPAGRLVERLGKYPHNTIVRAEIENSYQVKVQLTKECLVRSIDGFDQKPKARLHPSEVDMFDELSASESSQSKANGSLGIVRKTRRHVAVSDTTRDRTRMESQTHNGLESEDELGFS